MVRFRQLLLGAAALALAAGCGAPAAPTPDSQGDGMRWVDIGSDLNVDNFDFGDDAANDAAGLGGLAAMSADEARALVPFTFSLPAWAPAGFTLLDQVEVVADASGDGYSGVIVTWQNADGADLTLQVSQANGDTPQLGQAGDAQPLTVLGQPATLVEAGSLGRQRLTLAWSRDGLHYALAAQSGAVSAADLVQMAESIP